MILPITAIILTINEEINIFDCLESKKDLCYQIIVVDSGSTDKTLEIVKQSTDKIFSHTFENYSKQRNWALENLTITNNWILNFDTDHRVTPELKEELRNLFGKGISNDVNGFLIIHRTIFMDRLIKHGGHYPAYHTNMFRKGFGKCEEKLYDQHYLVTGNQVTLKGDIKDIISDSLTNFTTRHNKWSSLEAEYQLSKNKEKQVIKADLSGYAIERGVH